MGTRRLGAFQCVLLRGGEGSLVRFRVHYMKVYGLGLLSVIKGLGLGIPLMVLYGSILF